ncbi:hypothetical protein [Brevundimonas denitrificans]|uniref:hypothetical protein n=1 Tax=Brevundimonas denitrificans TaxID=1443434 RepID=UPI00223BD311|nr:hypothetical protein [Brevundimonas denitrificans]
MFAQLIAALIASSLAQPVPYEQVAGQAAVTRTYQGPSAISPADMALFREGLAAARARDVVRAQDAAARIGDPVARKLVEWALIDTAGDQLSYATLAAANTAMADWPRHDTRRAHAEVALERAAMPADVVLSFFGETRPTTAQGALALAGALEQTGRAEQARTLIRTWWRDQSFEAPEQQRMLDRFGRFLTQDDHDTRLSMLLLGPHGPATNQMVGLASLERRATANAHMALRGAYAPDTIVAGLSIQQATDPGVVLERVRILRSQNRQSEAYALLQYLPPAPTHSGGQSTLWSERRNYFLDALQMRNWQAAYHAMNGHGFQSGERAVDAEFFAGWVALTKLNDPATAARHFEALRQMSSTPITQGRALYWLGRAPRRRATRKAPRAGTPRARSTSRASTASWPPKRRARPPSPCPAIRSPATPTAHGSRRWSWCARRASWPRRTRSAFTTPSSITPMTWSRAPWSWPS